eukprot:scaffold22073_cov47-Attheya_sp.AAC.1
MKAKIYALRRIPISVELQRANGTAHRPHEFRMRAQPRDERRNPVMTAKSGSGFLFGALVFTAIGY